MWHLGVRTNPYKWWSSERETNYSPLRSVSWTLVAFLYEPLFSVHSGVAVAPSRSSFDPLPPMVSWKTGTHPQDIYAHENAASPSQHFNQLTKVEVSPFFFD